MLWNMVRLLVIVPVCLCVSFQSLRAQTDSSATAIGGIGKGTKMAQFAIASLSRSTDFNIMAGYYLTDRIVFRIDYRPIVSLRTETNTRSVDDSTWSDSRVENTDNQHSLSFTAYYVNYRRGNERVSFFWGIGPRLFASYDLHESEFFNNFTGRIDYSSYRDTDWGLGLSGIFGVEWFPKDWVGLFCDYGVLLEYSWYKRISLHSTNDPLTHDSREERRSHGFFLSDRGILVGVRAYF